MSYYELLLMIRRFRLVYLGILIITFFASFYVLKPRVFLYRAQSTFYLANESITNPSGFLQKGQDEVMQVMLIKERVSQFTYSNEMMNYLIDKFDLYKYYGINITSEYHYERMVKRLSAVINFNKVTPDMFVISVLDRDNIFAANMANELVSKLDELNKKYLQDKIEANLRFFETYLDASVKTSEEQNKKLFEYMEMLNQQRQISSKNINAQKPLSEIEFSMFQAASKIEDVTTQLIEARNLYEKALRNRQSNNLPNIIVIKKALPELNAKYDLLIFLSCMASLLSVST